MMACNACLMCLLVLSGCKSASTTATSGAAILKTDEAFFSSVLEHSFQFQTLSARLRLDYTDKKMDFSTRVQLKMIHDDRLQLSIQPLLGIEMFRIEVSNDSIKVLDRRSKRYVAERYDQLKDEMKVEFNFHNLQALLTNQVFVPGEKNISNRHFRRFRMTKEDDRALLKLKDANGLMYTFMAGGDEKLLSTMIEYKRQNQVLTWDYKQFQKIGSHPFPMKMTAGFSTGNHVRGTAVLNFSVPEVDQPLKMHFQIPSGYKRVTLEQIINSLELK